MKKVSNKHFEFPGEMNQEFAEMDESKKQIIIEIIEFYPGLAGSKTILKKTKGNVSAFSFDSVEKIAEKISPFSTFIQVIEGKAGIIIYNEKFTLEAGNGIIIPAHISHSFVADEQFKLISTVVKNVDEE